MAAPATSISAHLVGGTRMNVAQVLFAAQTELLDILGNASVSKVGRKKIRLLN